MSIRIISIIEREYRLNRVILQFTRGIITTTNASSNITILFRIGNLTNSGSISIKIKMQ